jgi:hypothetical protein
LRTKQGKKDEIQVDRHSTGAFFEKEASLKNSLEKPYPTPLSLFSANRTRIVFKKQST